MTKQPPFDPSPDNLTNWYRSYHNGNTGNCGVVCRLIEALATAKGYVRKGTGYETSFEMPRCTCVGLSHRNECPDWVLPY